MNSNFMAAAFLAGSKRDGDREVSPPFFSVQTDPSHRTSPSGCISSSFPPPQRRAAPQTLARGHGWQTLAPATDASSTRRRLQPRLLFSPVVAEEPPFTRHRGRASTTSRGPPPAEAPSSSTTKHRQRRTTPPSTPWPPRPTSTAARNPSKPLSSTHGVVCWRCSRSNPFQETGFDYGTCSHLSSSTCVKEGVRAMEKLLDQN